MILMSTELTGTIFTVFMLCVALLIIWSGDED